jgi:hypothetical protein
MTFEQLLGNIPGVSDFVRTMPFIWPISLLQDTYAPFGALHLVGLALLGGAVILLNLRLMGAGMTGEAPSVMEKNLRPWLITGVCIVIGTGIIIGMLNSEKLYKSTPFFVKMLSLASALVFTFGVSNAVAKAEGKVSTAVMVMGAIAFVIWAYAVGVFSADVYSAPGVFHAIAAGYAILLIYGVRTRIIAAITFALIYGGIFVFYWIVGFDTFDEAHDQVAQWGTIAGAVLLMGFFGYEIWKGKADAASPQAKLIALFSVLTWVTTAAGGRWIGFAT